MQKLVRCHLLIIIGLACSNPRAENALFTARHTLSVCKWAAWYYPHLLLCFVHLVASLRKLTIAGGGVLRYKPDQEAAEDFLSEVESRTGWSMAQTIRNLREQWEEDAE